MAHNTICNFFRLNYVCLVAGILVSELLSAQPRMAVPRSRYSPSSLRQGAGLQTIENGQIKVGINTNYGGAITYLAFLDSHGGKVSTANMVNNPDLGRQIQIALYSGPYNYPGYPGLGWDPIQAGDAYGNPSEVVAVEKQDNLLYAKTIPKQFGINNEPGEATIEHWIRLDGNVVKVHAKVVMSRSDHTQYEARQQEFPCVYLNGDFHNMWFYKGNSPYTNGSLQVERIIPPSTMLFGDIFPTEPWTASTNDEGYGVGLYVQDNYEWKRGYFGSDLSGDENSTVASYIAATNRVVLDYNLVYEWDYELIVGHLNDIRSRVYAKPRLTAGPNYRFDTSRKGWYYQEAQDSGFPVQDKLHIVLNNASNNDRFSSPYAFWNARSSPKLYLRAAFKTQHDKFRLKWRTSDEERIYDTGDRRMDFPIINDGEFHTYEIDMTGQDKWLNYNIGQIEFSTIREGPAIDGWVDVQWIATTANGPTDQSVDPGTIDPVVVNPVVIQTPNPVPCEPGEVEVSMKKIRYITASRKR